MNSDFPCTARAFFPEPLSNQCQRLRSTFSEICSKFDAVPLSDLWRYRIRPDTRLQIKGGNKISTSTQLREILYTDSQDILVLSYTVASRYYNFCTDVSTRSGNYGYRLVHAFVQSYIHTFTRKRNYCRG
jgi:hypothetical protein